MGAASLWSDEFRRRNKTLGRERRAAESSVDGLQKANLGLRVTDYWANKRMKPMRAMALFLARAREGRVPGKRAEMRRMCLTVATSPTSIPYP